MKTFTEKKQVLIFDYKLSNAWKTKFQARKQAVFSSMIDETAIFVFLASSPRNFCCVFVV